MAVFSARSPRAVDAGRGVQAARFSERSICARLRELEDAAAICQLFDQWSISPEQN